MHILKLQSKVHDRFGKDMTLVENISFSTFCGDICCLISLTLDEFNITYNVDHIWNLIINPVAVLMFEGLVNVYWNSSIEYFEFGNFSLQISKFQDLKYILGVFYFSFLVWFSVFICDKFCETILYIDHEFMIPIYTVSKKKGTFTDR